MFEHNGLTWGDFCVWCGNKILEKDERWCDPVCKSCADLLEERPSDVTPIEFLKQKGVKVI
jgi:hypothetical protein